MRSGLPLLAGIGLLVGATYVLTRKQSAQQPAQPTQPSRPVQELVTSAIRETDVVRATIPINIPTLDTGLTINEIDAISYALAREQSPQNLFSFGDSFLPDYPITAGLLLVKGKLLASPTDPVLRAAVEDGVRQRPNLLSVALALLPQFPQASYLLQAKITAKATG